MYPARLALLAVLLITVTTGSDSMATPVHQVVPLATTYRSNTTFQIWKLFHSQPHRITSAKVSPSSRRLASSPLITSVSSSPRSSPAENDTAGKVAAAATRKLPLMVRTNTIKGTGYYHRKHHRTEPKGQVHSRKRRSIKRDIMSNVDMDALKRLSRVFGIRRLPSTDKVSPHLIPPEYMTQLYQSTTDSGGLTKANSPYNADIVRSFPDRDYRHQMHFFYNVSFLEPKEHILQAEFHIFKLRPKAVQKNRGVRSHLVTIQIYQVLSLKNLNDPTSLKLIDVRRLSAYSHGWITFTVMSALTSWVNNTSPNYGFLIKATSPSRQQLNGSFIRFAQRREHHDTKQPILVVFTDDGLQKHRSYISPSDEGYLEIKQDILRHEQRQISRAKNFRKALRLLNEKDRAQYEQQNQRGTFPEFGLRRKRSVEMTFGNSTKHNRTKRTIYRRKRRNCARYEMYVDFNAIGWSGWIISPKGYNAYHCSGACPFPLGQSHKPTNHATVQSIVHALHADKNVLTPCCVPDKLYSISLLYFDDDENVILKLYEDMVAASCGCH